MHLVVALVVAVVAVSLILLQYIWFLLLTPARRLPETSLLFAISPVVVVLPSPTLVCTAIGRLPPLAAQDGVIRSLLMRQAIARVLALVIRRGCMVLLPVPVGLIRAI